MGITCFDREEDLHTNKVDSIVRVDIVKDVEMAVVNPKSVYSTFYRSRSGIQ